MASSRNRMAARNTTGLGVVMLLTAAFVLPGVATAQTPPPPPPPVAPPKPPAAQPAQPRPPAAAQSAQPRPPAAAQPAQRPPAQGAKPAAAAAAPEAEPQLAPDQPNPWVKICSKDQEKRDVCLVAQELRTDQGQLVGSVALREIAGDPKKMLLIAVPPLALIQPGLRVGVDKAKREEASFTICFPNACYAEMQVSDAFIASMKKSQVLVVTTLNLQEKPQNYPFGLAGFKIAHEGPGIDPTANAQNQQQLEQQLQKRADELRQKLSAEQPKSQ